MHGHNIELRSLIHGIFSRFGIDLIYKDFLPPPSKRTDAVGFQTADDGGHELSEQIHDNIRKYAEESGWHYIVRRNRMYFARIKPVVLRYGYHATSRVESELILTSGLRPSTMSQLLEGQVRQDAVGHIYFAETLGEIADEEVSKSFSGFWWCQHLYSTYPDRGTDWVILRVDLSKVPSAIVCADPCSTEAFMTIGVDFIPYSAISLVAERTFEAVAVPT